MKIEITVCHVGKPEVFWTEELETKEDGWPMDLGQAIIDNFNDTLKPGETARQLLSVRQLDAAPAPLAHDWEKSNLKTIIKGGKNYDTARCKACGATGKRFGLGERVTIDPRYKGRVSCPGRKQ